jgi:L-glyceraldehyde 3-phosphate reductase
MAELIKRTPRGVKPVQRDRLSWHQFSAEPSRYDKMTYRTCGNSGLKLPAISLGAWETFGGYRGGEIARECIFRAFNLGITHFDLANHYGKEPGRAELVIGRILREMPRDEIIVSTKAGVTMWPGPYGSGGSRKSLLANLDQSLQRLGLDYVDIFYSERPDPETPLEETLATLDQIVRSGKALYVGLSNYSGQALQEASNLSRQSHRSPIVVQQVVYNLVQRESEWDLLPTVRDAGAGAIAVSPLAQGLLTTRYLEEFPAESRAATVWSQEHRDKVTPSLRDRVRRLIKIAETRGQTLPQMAIAWVLRRPEICSALIGASDVEQIEENAKALENLNFSGEELQQIDDVLSG